MNDLEAQLKQVPLATPPASMDRKVAALLERTPRRLPVLPLAFATATALFILTGIRLLPQARKEQPQSLPSIVTMPLPPTWRAVFCAESPVEASVFQQPRTHIKWITPKGDPAT